jgi:hypothetical protein
MRRPCVYGEMEAEVQEAQKPEVYAVVLEVVVVQ